MKKRIFFLTLSLVAIYYNAAISKPNDYFNKSYALIVGIDVYAGDNWENLKYAVKDAQAIASFATGQGFIVKTLYNENATRENILNYIEDDLAKIVGPNDRFFFFFSGHGHTEHFSGGAERGYLVPHDGKGRSSTLLAMSRVRDISNILEIVRHQVYIMDCCYGGKLGMRSNNEYLDPRLPDYLEAISKRKARQVLTAGGADQRVLDSGPTGHSVFTGELLNALGEGFADNNGDGFITFYELASYVQIAAYRKNQSPGIDFFEGHAQGEFTFRNPKWTGRNNSDTEPTQGENGKTTRGKSNAQILKEAKQKFSRNDLDGALALFHELSELGNVEAAFFEGLILFKKGKKKEGLDLVTYAAENGNTDAMKALLEYYSTFDHFDQDQVQRWKNEIEKSEKFLASITLVDPTGGKATQGEPTIKPDALRLEAPKNLRIISQ